MKKLLLLGLLTIVITAVSIEQAPACPAPSLAGEKNANFICQGSCDFESPSTTWACTKATGNYKVWCGVNAIGVGGQYVVEINDITAGGGNVLQYSFTASGTCSPGSTTVNLTNGHQYEMLVDALGTAGCTNGVHAWAKMCYICQGS